MRGVVWCSGFHDRDASFLDADDHEEDWDSCIMEGYLQVRNGKMGDGKHNQKYFRMRDTMMVMYKKKSSKGKYGKGSARYLKVCSVHAAAPARSAVCLSLCLYSLSLSLPLSLSLSLCGLLSLSPLANPSRG
jgi:hypothetical protein